MFIMVYHALSWYINVYHGISCLIIFYQCLSWYIRVYHGISGFIMVYHGISGFIMVYHGISGFIMVYQVLSWYIKVYHCLSWLINVCHGLSWFQCLSWSIMVCHGLSWFIMVYHHTWSHLYHFVIFDHHFTIRSLAVQDIWNCHVGMLIFRPIWPLGGGLGRYSAALRNQQDSTRVYPSHPGGALFHSRIGYPLVRLVPSGNLT